MKKLKLSATEAQEPKQSKELDKYELDNHVDTLVKAHEITSDKDLHEKVKAHASKKAKKLTSVAQLRQLAKEMSEDAS